MVTQWLKRRPQHTSNVCMLCQPMSCFFIFFIYSKATFNDKYLAMFLKLKFHA